MIFSIQKHYCIDRFNIREFYKGPNNYRYPSYWKMQPQNKGSMRQAQVDLSSKANIPTLPAEYLHYSVPFKHLYCSKNLFRVLFVEWKVCLTCVLKIYAIEHPRLYSDSEFLAYLIKQLLSDQISEEELFTKRYCPLNQILDVKNCWLCEQLLQRHYLKSLESDILALIKDKKYTNYKKYKLNIRVPLIFTLKYYFLCHFLWNKFQKINEQPLSQNNPSQENDTAAYIINCSSETERRQQLSLIQEILSKPYDKLDPKHSYTSILEMKVIQKWLISFNLNTNTDLQSTIEDLQDMVTINIEHDYRNHQLENNLMQIFHHMVGLEKKHQWKGEENKSKGKYGQKARLEQEKEQQIQSKQETGNKEFNELPVNLNNEEFKCIANNVNKILYLKYDEIKHLLDKIPNRESFMRFFEPLKQLPTVKAPLINSQNSVSRTMRLETKNIYFCGKYCKYSRYLSIEYRFISQTPWMVNNIKLTDGSLSEQIQDRIIHHFYPGINKKEIQTKFHSGGREDIDVRMLKGGRPFVLQLVNPILRLKDLSLLKIIEESTASKQIKERIVKELNEAEKKKDLPSKEAERITFFFEKLINYSTELVQVHDLLPTTETYITVELKRAESEKIKHYVCYIISEDPLTPQDKILAEKVKDLEINQKTPIRVMHRRTVMTRSKMVHKMYLHQVSKFSAVLQLWGSAGCYIKEFVHGDLGRTVPNLGSILGGKKCDILQLDVGSLKEGDWDESDLENMRLKGMGWMDEELEKENQQAQSVCQKKQ